MNLGALAASVRLYVRWYRCGCTVRKTYSLDQCSHSLTLRTQQRSVLTTITRWHTRCEPSALSASHSSRRRLLALFLLPPLLFPSRNSWLCFCFRLPFGRSGEWMISTELRFFFFLFPPRYYGPERSCQRTRASRRRAAWGNSFFFFNFFISFFTFYFGGEAVRFQTKKINKISLLESATATCWRSGYVLEGFFTAQVRWGIKNRQLADGCRFRGEESLPLRKVSDGETLTVEFVQQINYWSVLMDSIWSLDHSSSSTLKVFGTLKSLIFSVGSLLGECQWSLKQRLLTLCYVLSVDK